MIITFKTPEGKPMVQIRSMSDGLNYQVYLTPVGIEKDGKLYNKRGKVITSDWIAQQCYAQSIDQALRLGLREYLLLFDEEADIAVTDKVAKESAKVVEKWIKEMVAEVEK